MYRDLILLLGDFYDVFFPSLRFYLNRNPKRHGSTITYVVSQDQTQSTGSEVSIKKAVIGQPKLDRISHNVKDNDAEEKRDPDSQQ